MVDLVLAPATSSTTDNIAFVSALVAALAAVVAAVAASWTIKLTKEASRELILREGLERLMLVAERVSDLRWEARAEPFNIGKPLEMLGKVLPLAPASLAGAEERVNAWIDDLETFFSSSKEDKRAFARSIYEWAKNAGDQLGTDIQSFTDKLAKLEG